MDGLGRLCLLIKKTYLHSGFFDINHHNVNNLFNDFANRKFNVIGDFWTIRVQYKENTFTFIAKPSTFLSYQLHISDYLQTTQVDSQSPLCSCLNHNNMWQTSC